MQNNAYQQLAKEFMDLWQKQISSVVSDKQFIQAMLEMFQNMQNPGNDRKSSGTNASDPAHSADADHGMLAELAFRIASLEKRVAALESGQGTGKRGDAKSSGRGGKKPRK